jgi:hypothetical protein
MKRLTLMAGVLALGLAGCAQNNGLNIGQGFGMDANVTGAKVTLTRTPATATAPATISILITQPTIIFNARPQSVGFELQKYTVEVLDNAGARYAADQGIFQRSVSSVISPGFVCVTAGTGGTATPLEQCAPNAKSAANVATPIGSLSVITGAVADQIATDCQVTACPTLKLKITFSGVDDAGRSQNVVASGADLFIETK